LSTLLKIYSQTFFQIDLLLYISKETLVEIWRTLCPENLCW